VKGAWAGLLLVLLASCQQRTVWDEAAARLPAAKEVARKSGIPLDPEDYRRLRTRQGVDLKPALARIREDKRWRAFSDQVLKPGTAASPAVFAANQDLMAQLEQLENGAYVGSENDDPFDFVEFATAKNVAKALLARAKASDLGTAVADLRRVSALAEAVAEPPTLVRAMVASAIYGLVDGCARELALRYQGSSSQIARVLEALPDLPLADLATLARVESYSGQAYCLSYEFIREGGDRDSPQAQREPIPGNPAGPEASAYLARFLEAWSKTIDRLDGAKGDFDAQREAIADLLAELRGSEGPSYNVLRETVGVWAGALDALATAPTRRAMTQDFLRVLAFKADRGRLPKPEEFAPKGRDLFANAPLRYRKDGDGFKIWSIGANRRDDGGDARRVPSPFDGFDTPAEDGHEEPPATVFADLVLSYPK